MFDRQKTKADIKILMDGEMFTLRSFHSDQYGRNKGFAFSKIIA